MSSANHRRPRPSAGSLLDQLSRTVPSQKSDAQLAPKGTSHEQELLVQSDSQNLRSACARCGSPLSSRTMKTVSLQSQFFRVPSAHVASDYVLNTVGRDVKKCQISDLKNAFSSKKSSKFVKTFFKKSRKFEKKIEN